MEDHCLPVLEIIERLAGFETALLCGHLPKTQSTIVIPVDVYV